MNAMAEKLQAAGLDTVGARLTTACTEAIRRHPDSVVEAWRHVGALFGHEFVRGIMADMQRAAAPKEHKSQPTSPLRHSDPAPYKSRVIPPERIEKRRELQQLVRSKYKNSGGIAWSDVGWHELHSLKRDGGEAKALLEAGPAHVPNDGRTVGNVLGIQKVDEIIRKVRP